VSGWLRIYPSPQPSPSRGEGVRLFSVGARELLFSVGERELDDFEVK